MKRSVINVIGGLLKLVGKFGYVLIGAMLNGILGNLLAISIGVLGSLALLNLIGYNTILNFYTLIGLMVGFGILRGAVRYFEQYLNHFIAFKILAIVRSKVFKAVRSKSYEELDQMEKGNLFMDMSANTESLEVFYAHTLSPIGIALFTSLIVLIFLGFTTHYMFAIVALISYLIIGILIPIISYKALKKDGKKYRENLGSFNDYFLDSISGINETRLYNNQKTRKEEINKRSEDLDVNRVKNDRKSHLFKTISEAFIVISSLTCLVAGFFLYQRGELTLGGFIVGIVTLISSFGPVLALAALPNNLVQTFTSGSMILDLIEKKSNVRFIENKQDIVYQNLSVNNLHFKYDKEAKNEIFNGLSLSTSKHEIIGIKGKSGIGKSTLFKLLLNFYESNGSIKYNNIDIDEINSESLLDNVTMFSQSTYLFNESIRDNLLIAKKDASNEKLEEALRLASIDKFVKSLDNGLDEIIDNNNLNISLGEKQRLGLARVILKKPRLLLLDEPTSNIDYQNEMIFLKTLLNLKNDMTIILITHQEEPLRICDRKFNLEEGILHEIN